MAVNLQGNNFNSLSPKYMKFGIYIEAYVANKRCKFQLCMLSSFNTASKVTTHLKIQRPENSIECCLFKQMVNMTAVLLTDCPQPLLPRQDTHPNLIYGDVIPCPTNSFLKFFLCEFLPPAVVNLVCERIIPHLFFQ